MVNNFLSRTQPQWGMPMCIAVANRIINRTNANNLMRHEQNKPTIPMNGRRLQKILYLCQLYWIAEGNDGYLIPDDFKAWAKGPVIPKIYDYFSVYQDGGMLPYRNVSTNALTDEESTLINKAVDNTIDIPTEAMIDYTHTPGGPWALVYKEDQVLHNNIIPKESIKQYIRNPKHQEEFIAFIKKYQKCV